MKQDKNNFKELMLKIFDVPNKHIVFVADDIVVKDYVNFNHCIRVLEEAKAHGFYLRCGMNLNSEQTIPIGVDLGNKVAGIELCDGIFAWQFKYGESCWNCPYNNDMTVYRKKDVKKFFKTNGFDSLAYQWNAKKDAVANEVGLCFDTAKVMRQEKLDNKEKDDISA
jgi:hypothetical protein